MKIYTRRFVRSALFAVVISAGACSRSQHLELTASPDIPAATSTAKVSSTDNGNTQIDLTVKHLALPGRVTPGATVYVVWVRGRDSGSQPQNLGALKVDGDLNGNLLAVTALQQFELFVTAETNQTASAPTGRSLLFTSVAR